MTLASIASRKNCAVSVNSLIEPIEKEAFLKNRILRAVFDSRRRRPSV